MRQRESITMTAREQRRAHVLARVMAGELKVWEAAVQRALDAADPPFGSLAPADF
jgi:hypothetical protein